MRIKQAWLIYLGLALLWGSSFILIKKSLLAFSPMQVAALRMVIAGICMLPFVWGKARQIKPQEWRYILLVGIFGNALPAFLFPLAETHINSASAGILNALSPIFVWLIGSLFLGLGISTRQGIGIILGFGGICLLMLGGDERFELGDQLFYAGMVVLATLGYGLSTTLMKKFLNTTPSILASGFALLAMALPYGVYLLGFSGVGEVIQSHPQAWTSLGAILILAAAGTALALVWYHRLVQKSEAVFAASIAYVIPVVALLWGYGDGENISLWQILAMGIILFGVYLGRKQAGKPSS